MNTLYLLLGVLIGITVSLLNVVLYFSKARDKVERAITKLLSKKAVIINTNNPLDEVDL